MTSIFTRLCTAAQVKNHLENIDTTELTDAQIQAYIDIVCEEIRVDYDYPYMQVVTTTETDERIYFLGEKDIYDIEKVFYDYVEKTETTFWTADLEKGTLTFVADPGGTEELRVWLIPRRFNELAAIRTALFIMRLSEGFQRGEPSKNLVILEAKHATIMRKMENFIVSDVDTMGEDAVDESPYSVNEVWITQDHDRNAYL